MPLQYVRVSSINNDTNKKIPIYRNACIQFCTVTQISKTQYTYLHGNTHLHVRGYIKYIYMYICCKKYTRLHNSRVMLTLISILEKHVHSYTLKTSTQSQINIKYTVNQSTKQYKIFTNNAQQQTFIFFIFTRANR